MSETKHSLLLSRIALLFAPFLLFGFALNYGFTIGEEFHFYQDFSLDEVISFFTSSTWPGQYSFYYRPLTQTSYFIDYQVWGLNPLGFHITSLLLYGLCLIALAHTVYLLSDNLFLANLTAIVFLFYPSHAHQPVLVTHRVDSLPLLLTLVSINFFLSAEKRSQIWRHAFGVFFCLMALLTKESAIVFPGLLAIVIVAGWSKLNPTVTRAIKWFLPYGLVTFAFLALRLAVLPSLGVIDRGPLETISPLFAGFNVGISAINATFFQVEATFHSAAHALVMVICMLTLFGFLWNHFGVVEWKGYTFIVATILLAGIVLAAGLRSMDVYFLFLSLTVYCQLFFFARGIIRNWSQIEYRIIGLGFVWIWMSNVIYVTKPARDRLMFIPSVGICLIVAVAIHLFRQHYLRVEPLAQKLGTVRVMSVVIMSLLLNYLLLGQMWARYFGPDSIYSHYANLVWYPAAKAGFVSDGRQADDSTIKLYESTLLQYRLVDPDNHGLAIEENYLVQAAYWPFRPDPVFEYLFDARQRLLPSYLQRNFSRYGLPIQGGEVLVGALPAERSETAMQRARGASE